MQKNYLYFSHSESGVLIYLFQEEGPENIKSSTISVHKQKLQECLVEDFSKFMSINNMNLENINTIYIRNIESTWNANRLVCLFVKTIAYYRQIPIYVGKLTQEIDVNPKNIIKNLKTFVNLDNSINLQPFYNTCPITNT